MIAYDDRSHKRLHANRSRYIAQSILHGFVSDPLPDTEAEAVDIIRWHYETKAPEAWETRQ